MNQVLHHLIKNKVEVVRKEVHAASKTLARRVKLALLTVNSTAFHVWTRLVLINNRVVVHNQVQA
jgi:hypothetical protein